MQTLGCRTRLLFTDLTKEVVFGQGIQNPRGSYEVTHGSRHSGGVNPNCHHWWPYIDVPQETVVSLQKVTKDNASKKKNLMKIIIC